MKIALAQIDVKAGLPEVNIENMLGFIEKAKKEKADIVAFPEHCVGGYLIGDLWTDDEWCEYLMSFNKKIQEASENIAIIFGNIYLDHREYLINSNGLKIKNVHFDGRKRRYNATYIYANRTEISKCGRNDVVPKGVAFKSLLPNYRYFDDKRYFASPLDLVKDDIINIEEIYKPFIVCDNHKKHYIGIETCEELWFEDYNINPTQFLAQAGADIIINISASPWTYGKNAKRDRVIKKALNWNEKSPLFIYLNCVGAQNSNGKTILVFNGASSVYGKDGEPKILANSDYEEQLLICDTEEIPEKTSKRIQFGKIHEKYNATRRGIKHIIEVSGIDKFVIGISGGLDSAVASCIICGVVGKENVIAVNMPSKFNSEKTKLAAFKLTRNLGLSYVVQSIEKIYAEVYNSLSQMAILHEGNLISSLVEENIQAKIRGTDLLSNFAQMLGALFVNTSNKLEIASGYGTLYGDWGGAFSVLGDITKAEVCDMARYINEERYHREIIPEELLPDEDYQFDKTKIIPSAELKSNQIDPILIKYHCSLIEKFMDYKKIGPNKIMKWWLEGVLHTELGISKKLMEIYKVNEAEVFLKDLKWFIGKIRSSVFKRVQSPPIICLSKTSFGGGDLRESIFPPNDNIFNRELEKEILEKKNYQ